MLQRGGSRLTDAQGLRLVAMTQLPINRRTIVLGSADAGVTVHDSDRVVYRKVRNAAEKLFLAEHRGTRPRLFGGVASLTRP